MTGCQTCGGYGMHHDPVTHGDVLAPKVEAVDALAYLARLWLRNQTAADHIFTRWLGDDDCGTYWPEIVDECREELDRLRAADELMRLTEELGLYDDDPPVAHGDEAEIPCYECDHARGDHQAIPDAQTEWLAPCHRLDCDCIDYEPPRTDPTEESTR